MTKHTGLAAPGTGTGNDNPSITNKSIKRSAERDGAAF
jgi:hypothetical protein